MELDGLRAWIGLVERKLTMRTRVFLVLVAIAVGGAGAAIYLAIDARDSAVSESELRTTRDELAAQIAAGGGAANVSRLETEVAQLKLELEALRDAGSNSGGGAQEKGTKESPNGGTGGARPPSGSPKALLEELKEQAQ